MKYKLRDKIKLKLLKCNKPKMQLCKQHGKAGVQHCKLLHSNLVYFCLSWCVGISLCWTCDAHGCIQLHWSTAASNLAPISSGYCGTDQEVPILCGWKGNSTLWIDMAVECSKLTGLTWPTGHCHSASAVT